MPMTASCVAYRWVALVMALAALGGWASFFHTSQSVAAAGDSLERQVKQLQRERERLAATLDEERAKTADIADASAKLALLKENVTRASEAEVQAKASLAAAQGEIASRRAELATLAQQLAQARTEQVAADQTASVRAAKAEPRRKRFAKRGKKRR